MTVEDKTDFKCDLLTVADSLCDEPTEDVLKFKEVLLYILEKVGSKHNVGKTVLYKLLYFIDFDYYELYEEQLIGAKYIKNTYGPTPVNFQKIINEMVDAGDVEIISSKYFDREQTKYLPVRKARLNCLSGQEIQHIDNVLFKHSDKTANELSSLSHRDVPWIGARDKETISYESVFYRTVETSVRNYDL